MTRSYLLVSALVALVVSFAPASSAEGGSVTGQRIVAPPNKPIDATMADGVRVTLEPNAVGMWMPQGKLPTESSGWTMGYHFLLISGQMQFHVPSDRRGEHAFTVSTRAGTITGWRGTVIVHTERDWAVAAAYEGALAVGSNGRGIRVYDGQVVTMRRDTDPTRREDVPPAPRWIDAGQLPIFANRTSSPDVTFRWSPVPRAVAYRVQIALDASMTDLVRSETIAATQASVEAAIGAPHYYARVRAVDADGILSRWSSVSAQHVIRIELPEGAFVAKDGALVAPRGAPVSLVGHEMLEVALERTRGEAASYGVPLRWMAAPRALRVDDDDARIVHLRDKATGATNLVTLAPRTLRARVRVGPARATWPRDPVDVAVTLDDPSGRLDATSEEVTLEAKLGIAPLHVTWRREGRVIRGRIPPRDSSGPWVVRVTARDRTGTEIGHGFLEVVADRGRGG